MENPELKELIERLRKYSEEEYNAHNNYIAEDLKDAADLLQQSMDQRNKIAVETPLGRLEACIGGDPQYYPEIFTYLVRPDGVEIDLTACEVKTEEEIAKAYVYGDTQTVEWTRSFQWTKEDITIDMEKPLSVLIVEPEKEPYLKEIDAGLESLQHAVGGDIQAIYPFDDPVAIICNDEAKLKGLPLNRALRDDEGDIYDVVAGTFMITGLGKDDFCSLTPEQAQKYSEHFKTPETFMRFGGKTIVLPMCEESQQNRPEQEPREGTAVDMDTSGLSVAGHIGTWHTIDHTEIDGHTFWLMEHDAFGDNAACIIVDEHGELVLSQIFDGFDEHTEDLLRQEIMPVDRMPDDSISVKEMKEYGYAWGGMLPMRESAASEVWKTCTIYRLYDTDTEGMVMDISEIRDHADKGGIFGVEKVDWISALERASSSLDGAISAAKTQTGNEHVAGDSPKAPER